MRNKNLLLYTAILAVSTANICSTAKHKNINEDAQYANHLIEQGALEEALEIYFEQIIPKIKNSHGVWHNIGHIYRLLGKPTESIKAYEKALSIDRMFA